MSLEIVTVPCLSDNYAYLLRDGETGTVALVDAPEPGPIVAAIEARGWTLDLLLITHHHYDHVDGVEALRARTGCAVWGAAADAGRLPPLDRALAPGDSIAVGASTGVVLDVPGHTVGHIAFHFPADKAVFTADSLMALGCGRLFEGTALQMWTSLSQFLGMDRDTLVCSGHEYTQSNARFALTIERDNAALTARAAAIDAARAAGRPTVPSSLGEELDTNPFLRAGLPSVKAAVGLDGADDAAVFAEIRRRKDDFRG
ncbi:hydroxyacylglutathione hydrolase [Paroceanicella profunda]|uniref:Hydroxyacylglutathione hydrolase n=1 Tax=Paroceanicella profunda TaxID=2579971 RepID=A0A5B8FZD2_9RHOB|nr:hydroxyacylglutathione hydrolase [Paroceanicella profunda]QDL91982.1 hydroxyacylglutathione hydrolase [Paroceanicella profunda]